MIQEILARTSFSTSVWWAHALNYATAMIALQRSEIDLVLLNPNQPDAPDGNLAGMLEDIERRVGVGEFYMPGIVVYTHRPEIELMRELALDHPIEDWLVKGTDVALGQNVSLARRLEMAVIRSKRNL